MTLTIKINLDGEAFKLRGFAAEIAHILGLWALGLWHIKAADTGKLTDPRGEVCNA